MTAVTQNQFAVTLTFEGNRIPGLWEKKSGGLADSNTTTYMPGGMGPMTALAGAQIIGELTLDRVYDPTRDQDVIDTLLKGRGRGRCVVKQVDLDANGAAVGNGLVWTGILKSVNDPDYDSSSTTPAMMEIVITTDGTVARAGAGTGNPTRVAIPATISGTT